MLIALYMPQRKAARRAKRKGDPYYLETKDELDIDSIPIVKLELDDGR